MNETVNLPGLISRISAAANVEPAIARRFLHDLFATIERQLNEGESVQLKGIGEFSVSERGHLMFRPDETLAAELNEPFEAFTAVELNEGAEAALYAEDSHAEPASPVAVDAPTPAVSQDNTETGEETTPAPQPQAETAVVAREEEPQHQQIPPAQPESMPAESAEIAAPDTNRTTPAEETDETEDIEMAPTSIGNAAATPDQGRALWLVLGLMIGLVVGLFGGYFAGKTMGAYTIPEENMELYDSNISEEELPAEPVQDAPDTIAVQNTADSTSVEAEQSTVPAQQAPAPVYDTVTSTRYLSIIARDHYGTKNYWIFIYRANPELQNPNTIRPGTRVVIPPKSSFECATRAETDALASRLIAELSKKYKF